MSKVSGKLSKCGDCRIKEGAGGFLSMLSRAQERETSTGTGLMRLEEVVVMMMGWILGGFFGEG